MNVTLDNLGNGVAVERFHEELTAVIENISDPNTDHKIKRKITLEVSFTPNEDRSTCNIEIQSKRKLAPSKPVQSMMHVGISQHGEIHAEEWQPEQIPLFDQSQQDGNKVASIR